MPPLFFYTYMINEELDGGAKYSFDTYIYEDEG